MAASASDTLAVAAIIGVVGGIIKMYSQGITQANWNKNVDQTLIEHTVALRDGDKRLNMMEVRMERIQANTEQLLKMAEKAERAATTRFDQDRH